MPPIVTDVTAVARGPSVCVSVTLMHPAKADGQNEVPFGRDTCEVPSNTVLDRGPCPCGKGRFEGWNPLFALMPPIAKLL